MYFLDPTPAYQISHFAKTFSPFHSRPIIRSKKTKYILKGQVQILNKTLVFFLFYKRTFYSTITVLVKGSYDTINHSDKGILFVAFQEHVCIHFYRVTIACEGDHNLGCPRGTRTKTVLNCGILIKIIPTGSRLNAEYPVYPLPGWFIKWFRHGNLEIKCLYEFSECLITANNIFQCWNCNICIPVRHTYSNTISAEAVTSWLW